MYTSTRRLAYRQELDILEDLASALEEATSTEEVVYSVADQWPADYYNLRVIQWLHAGGPDLDDTSATDGYQTATELVQRDNRNSVTKSIHDMLGSILYGMAHDYMFDVVNYNDTPAEALDKVNAAIAEHRSDLMTHDGYAMKPPYQFNIYSGHQATYTIHVTE
jgi:hypothetical protein